MQHHPIADVADPDAGSLAEALAARGPAALADARGQFALHVVDADGVHTLARDPLGVNKLFWAVDAGGEVHSANYLADLVDAGHAVRHCWSVPSGHAARIDPVRRAYELTRYTTLRFDDRDVVAIDDATVGSIGERLQRTFTRLAAALAGRPTYVCLSGGMDSTGVAVLAREHLGAFIAVTFALADESTRRRPGDPPDDLATAERLARDLGVEFLPVVVPGEAVLASLDAVLRYGQDWRDFNVHCGLVNDALGAAVAAHAAASGATARPVVLTGDTMNELMADYTPVTYRGRRFYDLPRVAPARLRRFLVGGLDAGDREVGVFGRHGVDVVQPYAWCAQEYGAIPAGAVVTPGAKQLLARRLFADRVPGYVYERPKVRAQAAGEHVGGTLGLVTDAGIDTAALAQRFARVVGATDAEQRGLVRAGFYRFPLEFPAPSEA